MHVGRMRGCSISQGIAALDDQLSQLEALKAKLKARRDERLLLSVPGLVLSCAIFYYYYYLATRIDFTYIDREAREANMLEDKQKQVQELEGKVPLVHALDVICRLRCVCHACTA